VGAAHPLYTLKRLKRDRPDLFHLVIGGEISANAAAKEAGWRKQPSTLDRASKVVAQLTAEEWDCVQLRENQRRYSVSGAMARQPWGVVSFSR
jgi:hypothetical protein